MNKVLKNVINKTIEREYELLMNDYTEHLKKNQELNEVDEEYAEVFNKAMHRLYDLIPKEHHHIIDELEEAANVMMGVESRVAFKEGLLLGCTELSYLGELGNGLRFI